jgi:hypothetical protein
MKCASWSCQCVRWPRPLTRCASIAEQLLGAVRLHIHSLFSNYMNKLWYVLVFPLAGFLLGALFDPEDDPAKRRLTFAGLHRVTSRAAELFKFFNMSIIPSSKCQLLWPVILTRKFTWGKNGHLCLFGHMTSNRSPVLTVSVPPRRSVLFPSFLFRQPKALWRSPGQMKSVVNISQRRIWSVGVKLHAFLT